MNQDNGCQEADYEGNNWLKNTDIKSHLSFMEKRYRGKAEVKKVVTNENEGWLLFVDNVGVQEKEVIGYSCEVGKWPVCYFGKLKYRGDRWYFSYDTDTNSPPKISEFVDEVNKLIKGGDKVINGILTEIVKFWDSEILNRGDGYVETLVGGTRLVVFAFDDYCVVVTYKLEYQSILAEIIKGVREMGFESSSYISGTQWESPEVVAYVFFKEKSDNDSLQKKTNAIITGLVEKINRTTLGWQSQEEKE